jgi:hypothetical protein
MVSVAGRCPPLGVHPFGSDVRLRLSSRPVSSRPVSGHLVGSSGIRLSGRLVSTRPSGHLCLVRSAQGWPGDHVGAAGTFTMRTDRDAHGLRCPSSSVDGPSRPEGGRRGGDRGGGRGSVGRGAGRVCSGASCGRGRPLTGQGPARREGRPSLPATPRHGSAGCSVRFLHLRVAASVAWTRDYAAWSLSSLTTEWTGLEGSTSSTVRMRRGPSAAQPGSERADFGPTTL